MRLEVGNTFGQWKIRQNTEHERKQFRARFQDHSCMFMFMWSNHQKIQRNRSKPPGWMVSIFQNRKMEEFLTMHSSYPQAPLFAQTQQDTTPTHLGSSPPEALWLEVPQKILQNGSKFHLPSLPIYQRKPNKEFWVQCLDSSDSLLWILPCFLRFSRLIQKVLLDFHFAKLTHHSNCPGYKPTYKSVKRRREPQRKGIFRDWWLKGKLVPVGW